VPHCDPELIALRALGEDAGTSEDDLHLSSCARCQSELDELRAIVATSRTLDPAEPLQSPPPAVWERISAELATDEPTASAPTAVVTPLRTRRRWSTGLLVAASLASLVAGVVAAVVVTGGSDNQVNGSIVASTSLDPLEDRSGTGVAEVVKASGGKTLHVDATGLTGGDGFYEVWLIDPDTFEMVGLGVLDGPQGDFAVPAGLDLARFSVVDVSLEPFDGDPAHSKDSVVRGQLSV
jgi:hypothetical protein